MRRNLTLVLSLALVLVLGIAAAAEAQGGAGLKQSENPAEANRVGRSGPATRALPSPVFAGSGRSNLAPGTITYDDGVANALPANSSFCYGNRFNTATGNPLTASGTITNLSYFLTAGAGSDNVFISFFDQLAGTGANVISSASVGPNVSGAFNTQAVSVNYVGTTFLAGVWYIGGDTVGLGAGTTGGQGFHGMQINDIVGTGYSSLGSLNALVRASGNIVIPVELTGFEVMDD